MNQEDQNLYGRFSRPLLTRLLTASRLDKSYHRAEGDYLWTRAANGQEIPILDMAGGYGVGMLGHNHPDLVNVLRQSLENQVPFHAQGSNRKAAGKLCFQLAELVGYATGKSWIVTLANTGTEAIEAAIKHAELERESKVKKIIDGCREHHRSIQEKIRNRVCLVVPQLLSGIGEGLGLPPEVEPDLEEIFHEVLRHNLKIVETEPMFLALENAFHGKTTGSIKLTFDPGVRFPFKRIGIQTRFLPTDDALALKQAVKEATLTYLDLSIDTNGIVRIVEHELVNIAGFFIEPIQGEGGIWPISSEYLQTVRQIADDADFPLIFDEIQSGCGRTGDFLASQTMGTTADYYILSKALGGGLAKISALLVDQDRYREQFGMIHTSTFAEDDSSCRISSKVLELIAGPESKVMERASTRGQQLLLGLRKIQSRYPTVLIDVRGRGLMLGIEFARLDESDSPTIRVLSSQGYLGFAIAGYLLNTFRIRVAPTLSRPQTLRIEPSAFLEDEPTHDFLTAIDRICRILAFDRGDELIRFLCAPDDDDFSTSLPNLANEEVSDKRSQPVFTTQVMKRRRTRPIRPDQVPAQVGRVSFLGHFIRPGDMRLWDPALTDFADQDLQRYMDRTHRLLSPFVSETGLIHSVTGDTIHLSFIGLPITPEHMHDAFREGDVRWVEERILEGVRLARRIGSSIVGLGGYISILTGQGTRISEDRLGITSGNAMTVATGVQALLETSKEMEIDLENSCLGALGATGNICSLYAQMMAEWVPKLVLIGRSRMTGRLKSVANEVYFETLKSIRRNPDGPHQGLARILSETKGFQNLLKSNPNTQKLSRDLFDSIAQEMGDEAPIRIEEDLNTLQDCNLIVAASSTPEPLIYPQHLRDSQVLICDLAVPEDTAPEVLQTRPNARIIRGGIVQLPDNPDLQLAGVPLEPGCVFACMAETLLLGLSRTSEHFSWGRVTKQHVERIRDLAHYHGFSLRRASTDSIL
ncbi:MAG: aminotransferase class III-fold pyridoxal phosphate-dependent enzyme [Planctomycetota bacterium]|nr:aminotransferase class III-fold pyridoxal phosphate-dependent enzyme [Planctomycetota bacterium]